MIQKIENIVLKGANHRDFELDVTYQQGKGKQPIVVFAHGFKGFKDWGHWWRIAEAFAEAGFAFVKFNFSHNGVTPENPLDFVDLEAFGQNNYMKEIVDIGVVIDWLFNQNDVPESTFDVQNITLIGHSRGGPIAILKALRDTRIGAVVTWASVADLGYRWKEGEDLENWRKTGVTHVLNGRTGQQMPLYFQLYENFKDNEAWLDTQAALEQLEQPLLIVHGDADPAVPLHAAHQLKTWKPDAELCIIEGANHVFGGKHPFDDTQLPAHTKLLLEATLKFAVGNIK